MMNISDSYLIPNKRISKAKNSDIHNYLEKILDVSYGSDNEVQNNILVITYLCNYISAEELVLYLGLPENSFKSLHSLLNYMVKIKLLHSVSLKKKDSCSRVLYYLTQDGFTRAASLYNYGALREFKRKGNDIAVMHDYCVGINALHILLLGIPFNFLKEMSFGISAKTGKALSGTLRVDGICAFNDRPERLFIEEDLGNEPIGTLVDKITKYQMYDHMNNPLTDSIIFSFRKAYCTFDIDCYSQKALKALICDLRTLGCNSLLNYIKGLNEANNASDGVSDTAYSLAKCVGLISKNGDYKKENDLDIDAIENFMVEAAELRNLYKIRDLNSEQDDFSKLKFKGMAGLIAFKFRKNMEHSELYIESLMRGYSIWCVPTNLLINYLPFICSETIGYMAQVEDVIASAYPGWHYIGPLSDKFYKSLGSACVVNLRNIFIYNNRRYSIEYVSRDLGALFRAIRFRQHYLSDNNNITLICLVETFLDALFVSGKDFIDYKYEECCQGSMLCNRLVFLTKKDLLSGKLNFFGIDENKKRIAIKEV